MDIPTGENFSVYTRVSTAGQDDNTSQEQQLRECKEYGESLGWRFVEHLHDTKTGKAYKERVMINKLLKLISSKRAKHVIFYKVDRTARELSVFKQIVRDIYDNGGTVTIMTKERTYRTAAECYSDNLLEAVFAEVELTTITTRLQGGLREQFMKGSIIKTLYLGYRSEQTVKNGTKFKSPAIDEKESETVRFIISTYLETQSIKETLYRTNQAGYLSRRGNSFNFKTIKDILESADSYAGIPEKQYFDKEQTLSRLFEYPPIISKDDARQVKFLLSSKVKQRISHGVKPFDRLVRCSHCGKVAQVYKHSATKGHHKKYDGGYRIQCASFLNAIQRNYANKGSNNWNEINCKCRHQFKEGTFIRALESYLSNLDSLDIEQKYYRDIAEMLDNMSETRDILWDCEHRRDEIDKKRTEFNENMSKLMSVPDIDITAFAKNASEQLSRWETELNSIADEYEKYKEMYDREKAILEYLGIKDVENALDEMAEMPLEPFETDTFISPIKAAHNIFINQRMPAVIRDVSKQMKEHLLKLRVDLAARDWAAVNDGMFKLGLNFTADFSVSD